MSVNRFFEGYDPPPADLPSPAEYAEPREAPRCGGEGEFEVGTRRDEFGTWDTEVFKCPGCPDCGG